MMLLKVFLVEVLILAIVLGHPLDSAKNQQSESKECNNYWWTLDGDHFDGNPCQSESNTEDVQSSKSQDKMKRQNEKSAKLTNHPAFNTIGSLMNIVNSNLNLNVKSDAGVACKACKTGIQMMKVFIALSKSNEDLLKVATGLCIELKIMTEEVCEGLIRTNGPAIIHILKASKLTPLDTCSFLVKTDCDGVKDKKHIWKVDVPKVDSTGKTGRQLDKRRDVIIPDAPQLKVLHISDTHFDPQYREGIWAECSLPLCCREATGEPGPNASLSGLWGGWKCDIPERTLDNMLEHISKQHPDIDYVIWTGDLPPHDSWSLVKNGSLEILDKTLAKMVKHFPNVPVYPALGNHETVPPNLFPPSDVAGDEWSVHWLFERLEKGWSHWLGNETSRTLRQGAFYTTKIRPGLRIVSLNMNYCYYNNWWLILNSTDPMDELKWLVEVLQDAERIDDKVHIIGHIPAGYSDCLKVWQENYYKIIERFNHTVRAQFFGHTHTDEFELFYSKKDLNHPVGVAYVGPSVTTYTYLNPGYRIYYVDGDHEETTRFVTDHETWIMNLEAANHNKLPVWEKLYSAKSAYNMTSLTPQDWHEFFQKLVEDESVMDLYYKHYWKDSPKRPECNDNCKKKLYCDIRSCDQYDPIAFG